jgi:hypothetical protein
MLGVEDTETRQFVANVDGTSIDSSDLGRPPLQASIRFRGLYECCCRRPDNRSDTRDEPCHGTV